jgi:hypothetical protein
MDKNARDVADDVPSAAEVADDCEGEQETIDLQINTGDEDDAGDEDDEDSGDEEGLGFLGLEDVVKNASKGVTEGTDNEYRRYYTNCPSFWFISDCCIYPNDKMQSVPDFKEAYPQ